jgi:transposase
MWLKYAEKIQESPAELAAWEQRVRGRRVAGRVRMLRLLKTGAVRSRGRLVEVLGYCERHLQRWWRLYEREGLAALVRGWPQGGRRERVSPEAWRSLTEVREAGQIGESREGQRHLHTRCGIRYRSLSGVSRLLKWHGVKLKTGRRRHRKASLGQQEAFKTGLRGTARGPRS